MFLDLIPYKYFLTIISLCASWHDENSKIIQNPPNQLQDLFIMAKPVGINRQVLYTVQMIDTFINAHGSQVTYQNE